MPGPFIIETTPARSISSRRAGSDPLTVTTQIATIVASVAVTLWVAISLADRHVLHTRMEDASRKLNKAFKDSAKDLNKIMKDVGDR